MAVEIRTITGRRELKQFIYLPSRIHRNHKIWMPPIYMDEWRFYDAKKNRAFSYSDTTLALAWQGKEPVGRIMGIINRRHNELRNERTARFSSLECHEDRAVFDALMAYVENWARAQGMNKLVGPLGFSDQDPEGFLIEGFDAEPTLTAYINFEFLVRFLEAAGYTKEVDYVDYIVPVPEKLPDLYEKISVRVARQQEFRLVEFRKSGELKLYIHKVFGLMNETYRDIYGYVPMLPEEMDALAKQYLPLVDPRFVKVVVKGDDVVAFVIGIPNMNAGIRKARGEIFPFGILHIMAAIKKSRQLDLFLGAIREDCRGRGLDALLGAAMMRSAIAAGMTQMDSHHELEANSQVRAEMERVGGKVVKRFRIFQKAL
jgi:hypothetical protein